MVGQQLESYNEFIHNTIQEIVDDDSRIIHQTSAQHAGDDEVTKQYTIEFGQIYLSKAMMTEADGSRNVLFPNEARLRNLTYSVPLYVDMKKEIRSADPSHPENMGLETLGEMIWEVDHIDQDFQKVGNTHIRIIYLSIYIQNNNLIGATVYQEHI